VRARRDARRVADARRHLGRRSSAIRAPWRRARVCGRRIRCRSSAQKVHRKGALATRIATSSASDDDDDDARDGR